MASIFNKLRWGGDPDQVNEISGLTPRDIYTAQTSWAVVHADPTKYGFEIFRIRITASESAARGACCPPRLFRADPDAKAFFKSFENLTEAQLASNFQFRAHAINFVAALNQAVRHLKEPEVVIAMMNKLGTSHGKRLVRRKHFNIAREVLFGLMNDLKMNNEVMVSWDKCINFLFQHIYVKLDS